MDRSTREFIRRRAGDQCEYCGMTQDEVPLGAFHVEHIRPRQHGGNDDVSNLALARFYWK